VPDARTQNGSRAIGSSFLVEDPAAHIPGYTYRTNGDGYQFSWYGSYPQAWGSKAVGFQHLDHSTVEYIRDVQLGSVNISGCAFKPWLSNRNPLFGPGANSTLIPPSVQLYNMDPALRRPSLRQSHVAVGPSQVSPANSVAQSVRRASIEKSYGCNVSDSTLEYIWDVDILESAVSRSVFRWAAEGRNLQRRWLVDKPANPSFWVNCMSGNPKAGFLWSLNHSLACMRPRITVAGVTTRKQNVTIDNASWVFDTHFLHTSDAICKG